jgi:hypothetical protein
MFRLNPGEDSLMACKHNLRRSQPGLHTIQRHLGMVESGLTSAQHHFRHRHSAARMTGNLLDHSQRPARKAPDFTLIPGRKVIADQQSQHAHRYPAPRFFGTHKAAPQSVMWVRRGIQKFVIPLVRHGCIREQGQSGSADFSSLEEQTENRKQATDNSLFVILSVLRGVPAHDL